MKNSFVLALLVLFALMGCSESEIQSPTLAPITFTLTPTSTLAPTSTVAPTSTPPSTSTLAPTLSIDHAHSYYLTLLETNSECRLPCWWGITPGETSWQDAQDYLETFTTILGVVDPSKEVSVTAIHIPLPKEQGTLTHTYYIKDEIVFGIDAFNFDWAAPLYLSNLLENYGPPDEVYFRVFYPGFQEEKFSFLIDLYYEEGILMEYSGGDESAPIDGIHKNCYTDIYSPFLYLWAPDEQMTAQEAIDTFLDNSNFPYPIPLETATGTNITTFYTEFRDANKVKCLETNQELWQ